MGPLGRGQRWAAARKRQVVLRLFRGEPLNLISRESWSQALPAGEVARRRPGGREEALKPNVFYRAQKTQFFQELVFVVGDDKGGNGRPHLFQAVE